MNLFDFDKTLLNTAELAEADCAEAFERIESTLKYNSYKVLKAFIDNKTGERHLQSSTGYGYGDEGRDNLDAIFAAAFDAEDALVRHNFVNGTHAISTALFGILRPGNKLLSLTGQPYDTLQQVIFGKTGGSLTEFGVKYDQVDFQHDGTVDLSEIERRAKCCRVAYIQRSRGYSLRPSITVSEISEMIDIVKSVNKEAIVIVDNCYGEFVERVEPTSVGADLIVGSLIKNPGGGIAASGGYIAGKKELVELCSYRLTTVGTGKEVGCSLNQNREMYMGFFHAPEVTANALKTSVFTSALFARLGFSVFPKFNEYRTDIITAINLGKPERLIKFCEGIQAGSPIDSYANPEPWDMPGYDCPVIMAAGTFTSGASIELSADAPIRAPYTVFAQGGVTYNYGKIGILSAAQTLLEAKLLNNKD